MIALVATTRAPWRAHILAVCADGENVILESFEADSLQGLIAPGAPAHEAGKAAAETLDALPDVEYAMGRTSTGFTIEVDRGTFERPTLAEVVAAVRAAYEGGAEA